jgi:hypothetical protein
MGSTWLTLDNKRLHMMDIGAEENLSWNNSCGEPNDQKEIRRIAKAPRKESKGKHTQSWINVRNYTCLPIQRALILNDSQVPPCPPNKMQSLKSGRSVSVLEVPMGTLTYARTKS